MGLFDVLVVTVAVAAFYLLLVVAGSWIDHVRREMDEKGED